MSPHFYRRSKGLVFARRATRFRKGYRKKRKYRLRHFFKQVFWFKKRCQAKKVGVSKRSFKKLKFPVVKSYKIKKILGIKKRRGKVKGLTGYRTFLFRRVQRKFKLTPLFVQKFQKKVTFLPKKGYPPRRHFLKGPGSKKGFIFSKIKKPAVKIFDKWKRYYFLKLKFRFRPVIRKIGTRTGSHRRLLALSRIRFSLPANRIRT